MNTDPSQSEVDLLRPPSTILVDEDALSPRFRAQMESVLAPLSVLLVVALFIFYFRKAGQRG